jgi:cell wall-associated NlpC family hydrolase
MIRRVLACAVLGLVLAAPASAATSWAQPQIKVVTARGLMGGKAAAFRPDDALTAGDLVDLVAGLTGKPQARVASPAVPVTVSQLDAQLVRGLGLLPVARQFTAAIQAAGLAPSRAFGTETVARLLGLRVNHPAAQDFLELGPESVATRAEAAYSAARILSLDSGDLDAVGSLAASFRPAPIAGLQRSVLQTAVSFVGYPYVWGGTSPGPETLFGVSSGGGFDCSGFVWRVYKLTAYTGEGTLAGVLRGRTTYQMSGEVPRSVRITAANLQPGDVMFFGANGPKSKPAVVDHTGLYLGNGWFVQSSSEGVTLLPFDGWYARTFAWARRPLREAGLSG